MVHLLRGKQPENGPKYPPVPQFVIDNIKTSKKLQELQGAFPGQDVYLYVCMTCGAWEKNKTQLGLAGAEPKVLADGRPCQTCMKVANELGPLWAQLGKVIAFQCWKEITRHERESHPKPGS